MDEPSEIQKKCASHGGFVGAAHGFDTVAFGVSHVEAHTMDPQHRLLLHRGYQALQYVPIPMSECHSA